MLPRALVTKSGEPIGGFGPGKVLDHAPTAEPAEPGPLGRVLEKPGDGCCQRIRVAAGHDPARLPDNLWKRAAIGADQRRSAGHCLASGQSEPFVLRGNHGHRGLGIEPADFCRADPMTEVDATAHAERVHQPVRFPTGAGCADEDEPQLGKAPA